jgi:gelsolin
MYEKPADVQPAYYRTADSSGISRMESGSDYKVGGEVKQASSPQSPKSTEHPAGRTGTPIPVKTISPQPSPKTPGGGGSVKVSTPQQPQHQQPQHHQPPQQQQQPKKDAPSLSFSNPNFYLPAANTEKEMKAMAAQGEPAWINAGKVPGIQIWRVEKFKIIEWPRDKYGYFFDGDSYIVLNSYGHPQSLRYNVHFWLGEFTTQDEAGTAAYKTVELDDYLGGLPVQYREVQGNESQAFLSIFDQIIIQSGGIETGFRHVEPEKYRHRLLHIKGTMKNLVVREVKLAASSLNSGDVFILDEGTEVYQFVGKDASIAEKGKAKKIMSALDAERKAQIKAYVLEEGNEANKAAWVHFWNALGGKAPISASDPASDQTVIQIREMYKVSDESGKLLFTPVQFAKSSLIEDDAFVVSTGPIVFVWIGKRSNPTEKKSSFVFAQQYLNDNPKLVKSTPIVRILSGSENEEFNSYFQI